MMKHGATRATMEAKVFGGGQVIDGMTSMNIGENNTDFVMAYLKTERIPIMSKDVLGPYPRKVCFCRPAARPWSSDWPRPTRRPWPPGPRRGAKGRTGQHRRWFGGPVLIRGSLNVMAKTRVVVVDDSALVRSLLSAIINRQPDMECVGAAADPLIAREMISQPQPGRDHAGRGDAAHGRNRLSGQAHAACAPRRW